MDLKNLPLDPFDLFAAWFQEAEATEPHDANAMALATASATGAPSVRMVLLKSYDSRGFSFFTNTQSRKGMEITENAAVGLNFHWKSLRRQIRIDGRAEAVTDAEADAYFAGRPRASQIGAWASDQSRPLDSRETLETRVAETEALYEGKTVPRPPHWSGYRVIPSRIEYWIDRRDRLHERYIYSAIDGGGWTMSMEYP